jgi:hypothetical protein
MFDLEEAQRQADAARYRIAAAKAEVIEADKVLTEAQQKFLPDRAKNFITRRFTEAK